MSLIDFYIETSCQTSYIGKFLDMHFGYDKVILYAGELACM